MMSWAAILKLQRHIRNTTPSIDAYLVEEQCYQAFYVHPIRLETMQPFQSNPMSATCVSTSTAILVLPPMYVEPCRAVSPHCDSFAIYVVTLPTTAFALSWSHLSIPGSIMATSCLSGSRPISNDVSRPFSTLQLAWYSDSVVMTTCLTPWRYCTGCVCQNGSIINWRSWRTEC